MEFNKKLQELRKRKGITQDELAQKLFVSRTAVSKWESGRGYPNIESLKAIADFFGVSLDGLLSADEAIVLAEENRKLTEKTFFDLVLGLSDVLAVLFLFLPLFAVRSEGVITSASLLSLVGVELYLKILYFVGVISTALFGVATLAFQGLAFSASSKLKVTISLTLSIALTLLFMISLQPYASVLAFALLIFKGAVLLRRH